MDDETLDDGDERTDGLLRTDLIPADGGAWTGLLFDNPAIGLAPRLTWTFDFAYRDAVRDYGDSPVSLTLDWIALTTPAWHAMTGIAARSTEFADGGEASVYFFTHHRYASIELDLLAQNDAAVHARATVTGDIDRLGIDSITAEAWLQFDGITVALSDAHTADAALTRLRDFTDTARISPTPTQQRNSFRFSALT